MPTWQSDLPLASENPSSVSKTIIVNKNIYWGLGRLCCKIHQLLHSTQALQNSLLSQQIEITGIEPVDHQSDKAIETTT
jgi:hypothetical protein